MNVNHGGLFVGCFYSRRLLMGCVTQQRHHTSYGDIYGYMTFLMIQIFIKYYAFPVQENTSISTAHVQFPDVSVCNADAISMKRSQIITKENNSTLFWFYNMTLTLEERLQTIGYSIDDADFYGDRLKSYYGYFENVPEEELRKIAHTRKDFILDCLYNREPCLKNSTFKPFFHLFPVLYVPIVTLSRKASVSL